MEENISDTANLESTNPEYLKITEDDIIQEQLPEVSDIPTTENIEINESPSENLDEKKLEFEPDEIQNEEPAEVERKKQTDEKESFLNENYQYKISDGFVQNSDIFVELLEIRFQKQIREDFFCNWCNSVIWKPVSLTCGHVVCDCCQTLIDNEGSCLIDQQTYQISEIQINDILHNEITESLIHCIEIECEWIGKLEQLEEHFISCVFKRMECPHCEEIIRANDLNNHVVNRCESRLLSCKYCDSSVNYKDLDNHEDSCNEKPVSCPNECKTQASPTEVTILKQGQLENHLSTECPERKIPCQFSDFNCNKMLRYRKLNIHLIKNSLTHLDDLCSGSKTTGNTLESQIQTIKRLKETIQRNNTRLNNLQLKCGPQLLWKVIDVKEKYQEAIKNKSNELLSTSFYSSPHYGYKLIMRIMLNGSSAVSTGRYISVFMSICDNPCNNLLTWPFKQKVTVHIINQKSSNHVSYTIVPNPIKENLDYLNKPTTDRNPFFGIDKFVPCSVIDGETEYVVDNTMYLKVNIEPYEII